MFESWWLSGYCADQITRIDWDELHCYETDNGSLDNYHSYEMEYFKSTCKKQLPTIATVEYFNKQIKIAEFCCDKVCRTFYYKQTCWRCFFEGDKKFGYYICAAILTFYNQS